MILAQLLAHLVQPWPHDHLQKCWLDELAKEWAARPAAPVVVPGQALFDFVDASRSVFLGPEHRGRVSSFVQDVFAPVPGSWNGARVARMRSLVSFKPPGQPVPARAGPR